MKDALVLGALLVSFATLLTTHVAISVRLLLRQKPRYRGLLALVVPPLAPAWAYAADWRGLCWLWVGSVVAYALSLLVALL